MKGFVVVLVLAGLVASAAAAPPDVWVTRTVGHVKRLERRDKFGLRERIGGAFKLSATSCGDPNGIDVPGGPVRCRWDATAVLNSDGTAAFGWRVRCSVEIRLRETAAHRVRWHRRVVACARQRWGYPS